MAWVSIPGTKIWERDDAPPDPGGAQTTLWDKQFNGIRINTYDGTEIYTKCRRIGTIVETSGELNKTYYDKIFMDENNLNEMDWYVLDWLNLDWYSL